MPTMAASLVWLKGSPSIVLWAFRQSKGKGLGDQADLVYVQAMMPSVSSTSTCCISGIWVPYIPYHGLGVAPGTRTTPNEGSLGVSANSFGVVVIAVQFGWMR